MSVPYATKDCPGTIGNESVHSVTEKHVGTAPPRNHCLAKLPVGIVSKIVKFSVKTQMKLEVRHQLTGQMYFLLVTGQWLYLKDILGCFVYASRKVVLSLLLI